MNSLINEFGLPLVLTFSIIALILSCLLLFLIIKWGVSAGNSRQSDLIETGNQLLRDIAKKP